MEVERRSLKYNFRSFLSTKSLPIGTSGGGRVGVVDGGIGIPIPDVLAVAGAPVPGEAVDDGVAVGVLVVVDELLASTVTVIFDVEVVVISGARPNPAALLWGSSPFAG